VVAHTDELRPAAGRVPAVRVEVDRELLQARPAAAADGPVLRYSQIGDASYKRLLRTVDLTGATTGNLSFTATYDLEPTYD
jgi:hypothetical protein